MYRSKFDARSYSSIVILLEILTIAFPQNLSGGIAWLFGLIVTQNYSETTINFIPLVTIIAAPAIVGLILTIVSRSKEKKAKLLNIIAGCLVLASIFILQIFATKFDALSFGFYLGLAAGVGAIALGSVWK